MITGVSFDPDNTIKLFSHMKRADEKLVVQTHPTCCGQACVAMVAGITLEESIKIFGHKRGTTTKQVRRALTECGWIPAEKLKIVPRVHRKGYAKLAVCLFKVVWPDKSSHWILNWQGTIYDPLGAVFANLEIYELSIKSMGGRVVSDLGMRR